LIAVCGPRRRCRPQLLLPSLPPPLPPQPSPSVVFAVTATAVSTYLALLLLVDCCLCLCPLPSLHHRRHCRHCCRRHCRTVPQLSPLVPLSPPPPSSSFTDLFGGAVPSVHFCLHFGKLLRYFGGDLASGGLFVYVSYLPGGTDRLPSLTRINSSVRPSK